jgi:inhibitor of KinA sporulation pathway (predicted exonuclease)
MQAYEIIYLDLEYCYPDMTRESGRPSSEDLRQVVQIAAIRFDAKTGKEVDSFDVLTLPKFETILPEFFVELTSITQEDVATQGISFPEALEKLQIFIGETPVRTFHLDEEVLRQNCGYFEIDFPLTPFARVKDMLPDFHIDPNQYSSGTLYKAVGLTMEGWVHNALHDVRSMAQAMYVLEKEKGQPLEVGRP